MESYLSPAVSTWEGISHYSFLRRNVPGRSKKTLKIGFDTCDTFKPKIQKAGSAAPSQCSQISSRTLVDTEQLIEDEKPSKRRCPGVSNRRPILCQVSEQNQPLTSNSNIDSDLAVKSQKPIRIKLLTLQNGVHGSENHVELEDSEPNLSCTVKIVRARSETLPNGIQRISLEELVSQTKMGRIASYCLPCGTTIYIVQVDPFFIPAQKLRRKRESSKSNERAWRNEFEIRESEHSMINNSAKLQMKITLDSIGCQSSWPPMGLATSDLDPRGSISRLFSRGTYSRNDISLSCKDILISGQQKRKDLDIAIKLGTRKQKTLCSLTVEVECPLLPELEPPATIIASHLPIQQTTVVNDSRDDGEFLTCSQGLSTELGETKNSCVSETTLFKLPLPSIDTELPVAVVKTPLIAASFESTSRNSSPDSIYLDIPDPPQPAKPTNHLTLTVPQIPQRLFHSISKRVLQPGDPLPSTSIVPYETWRINAHLDLINTLPTLSDNAKDYITKWDAYMIPLRLSCKRYLPAALLLFVQENKDWFMERGSRLREFSLHATSLRIRGSIDFECFRECVRLLTT